MNVNTEYKEWIELFCAYDSTDYKGLSDGRMLEVFEWMKIDGFTEEQIHQAIDNYEKNFLT